MTQFALAEAAGMNYRHYQDIETGKTDPKVSTLREIAAAMGMPPCHLVGDDASGELPSIGMGCPCGLLDALPIGLAIINLAGLVLYVNRRAAEIVDRPKGRIEGKSQVWDLLFKVGQSKGLKKYIETVMKSRPEPLPYFTTVQGPNRSPLPIKVNWTYLKNAGGELVGFLLLISVHAF